MKFTALVVTALLTGTAAFAQKFLDAANGEALIVEQVLNRAEKLNVFRPVIPAIEARAARA